MQPVHRLCACGMAKHAQTKYEESMKRQGMWYVIQVMSGEERRTLELCKALIDQPSDCELFLPEIEAMKRYHGEWHKEKRIMFPGYLFVVTDYLEQLILTLNKIPKLTKVLGCERTPVPLKEEEIELLQRVMNHDHVVEVSEGFLEGDQLVVMAGPMKGMEGMVKRIDRHKRLAWFEVELFGRLVEAVMGIEVVGRKDEEGVYH